VENSDAGGKFAESLNIWRKSVIDFQISVFTLFGQSHTCRSPHQQQVKSCRNYEEEKNE
jgi:hypothetical protein